MKRIMFHIFSQEKIHGKYKKVAINTEKCIGCERCVAACPVNMFAHIDNTIQTVRDNKHCILCAECYHHCPVKAIVHPYIEVARKRLSDGFAELENPQSEIYWTKYSVKRGMSFLRVRRGGMGRITEPRR